MTQPATRGFKHPLTPQEACLWSHLKKMRADGFHWRKQHRWSAFQLNFVCLSYQLVIEVDGAHHCEDERQSQHDLMRDNVLARAGFLTLRFTNREVDREIDYVPQTISEVLASRVPTRFAQLR